MPPARRSPVDTRSNDLHRGQYLDVFNRVEAEFTRYPLGHQFNQVPEIGAATGIDWLDGKRLQAVAEARRRGGGSAMALD